MKFEIENTVKIINVGVEHLKKYENSTGTIIGWICRFNNEYRYKVKFNDESTAYFKESEMEGVM